MNRRRLLILAASSAALGLVPSKLFLQLGLTDIFVVIPKSSGEIVVYAPPGTLHDSLGFYQSLRTFNHPIFTVDWAKQRILTNWRKWAREFHKTQRTMRATQQQQQQQQQEESAEPTCTIKGVNFRVEDIQ